MTTAIENICRQLQIPHQLDAPIGELTWYRTGGNTEVLAHPQSVEQLCSLMAACHEHSVPCHVLGRGANLLVAGFVEGLVVQLDAKTMADCQIDPDAATATAGAGADLSKVIMGCCRHGLAGLEGLAGIPATVGGAVRMNAGGRFGEIGNAVQSIQCITHDGQLLDLPHHAIGFDYRHTEIPALLITRVRFQLQPGNAGQLREQVKQIMAYKAKSQPLDERSAGCVFKNPPKDQSDKGAGQLIDEAGLKGYQIGGAEVSPRHANFIIRHVHGTADDIFKLMQHVHRTVKQYHGIDLENEMILWPDGIWPTDNKRAST